MVVLSLYVLVSDEPVFTNADSRLHLDGHRNGVLHDVVDTFAQVVDFVAVGVENKFIVYGQIIFDFSCSFCMNS